MRVFARSTVERLMPSAASNYRWLRDYYKMRRARQVEGNGVKLLTCDFDDPTKREAHEATLMSTLAKQCGSFIDIGANVGYFTILAAKAGLRSTSFEPQPFNVSILLRNLQLNGVEGMVEVFPVALGEHPGVLPLFGGGTGASLKSGWAGVTSTYQQLVPILVIDAILANREYPGRCLVKIDV